MSKENESYKHVRFRTNRIIILWTSSYTRLLLYVFIDVKVCFQDIIESYIPDVNVYSFIITETTKEFEIT